MFEETHGYIAALFPGPETLSFGLCQLELKNRIEVIPSKAGTGTPLVYWLDQTLDPHPVVPHSINTD